MTIKILTSFIILISFTNRVLAEDTCELLTGLHGVEKICWNELHKGWVSENCVNTKCEALERLVTKDVLSEELTGGQNPGAVRCHRMNQKVIILRDKNSQEQSYCLFQDKSFLSTSLLMQKTI